MGAIEDLLKSYGPKRLAYSERSGLTLDLRSRFKVIKHLGISCTHSLIGKSGYVVEIP